VEVADLLIDDAVAVEEERRRWCCQMRLQSGYPPPRILGLNSSAIRT
jgi:hypothetical protein